MTSIQAAIDGFYAAAILPERWPEALDVLVGSLASDGATLLLAPTRPHSIVGSTSTRPFLPKLFQLTFPDPREARVSPTLAQGFMPDHAYFSAEEIDRDPYYQEYLVPSGFGWNAAAALNDRLLISLKRAIQRGHYDQPDLTTLNGVLPSLRMASRAACMTWESHFCGELLAFESLGRGALLLDAQARILASNACTQFGDGLDIAGGTLRAEHQTDRQRLSHALEATIAAARSGTSSARMCVVRRPSGSLPWVLDVIACRDAMLSLHSQAAALLLITDLERPSRMSRLRLQDIFDLTVTEARLAQELANGRTLQEAAERLGISVGHARQRLKTVFYKTGVSRQPELVALLAKLI